jgi:hypothetical protein
MRMNTAPKMPSENSTPTMLATAKLRLRNRRSGIMGSGARASQAMNAISSAPPPISEARTSPLDQPASSPRTMPKTTRKTPAIASPSRSRRCGRP